MTINPGTHNRQQSPGSRRITALLATLGLTLSPLVAPATSTAEPAPSTPPHSRGHDHHGSGSDNPHQPQERVMNAANAIHARDIVITNAKGEKVTLDGSGTAVGLLDDGIDVNHPALKRAPKNPKIRVGGQSVKVIPGWDWKDNDATLTSNVLPNHGMHVAGIIAANGPTSTDEDAPEIYGVAPEAQIIFEKIQDTNGPNIVKDNVMADAMRAAIGRGADVINLSLGTDSATTNSAGGIKDAIKEAASQGVPVISTAGNQGFVGKQATTPLASNPDYGVVARPGIAPLTIDATSVQNTAEKGHGFFLKSDADALANGQPAGEEIAFNQPQDSSYANSWWRSRLDWSNYDTWYDYQTLDGTNIDYIVVDNPTDKNLADIAEEIKGKFIVVPRHVPGLSTDDNNPGTQAQKVPDFVLAARNAKAHGAAGVIIIDDSDRAYGNSAFYPVLWEGHYEGDDWLYDWDVWEELISYPIMAVSKNAGAQLKDATEKTIAFNASIHEIINPLGLTLSQFAAWGVTSDFVYKPDLATPSGGRVVSLGQLVNPNDKDNPPPLGVVTSQGTSMSAPQITGAVALIRQRLNEQYPELVKNPNTLTVHLIKNLLMSTAVPQQERYGDFRGHFYSPRVQGNGLMQVKEAALTDVVAISPIDSADNETGFAKTNLRRINDHHISFDIELQNYGHSPRSFTSYLYVLADNVADGHYTMHSDTLADGQKVGAVTVPARAEDTTAPGTTTVHVDYTVDPATAKKLATDSPNGFFLDGFVQFIPTDEDNQVELWHSFTGFDGDWVAPPLYDTFLYDLADGNKPFYYNTTPDMSKTGRDGDLNSSHLESMRDGAHRTVLGALPDYTKENLHVSDKHLAISPNNDGHLDSVNPVLTILRNYTDIQVSITNAAGEQVFTGQYGTGHTDRKKNFYNGNSSDGMVTEAPGDLEWKGLVEDTPLPEGDYHYTLKVIPDYVNGSNPKAQEVIGADRNEQFTVTREFDIKIDNTAPVLQQTSIVSGADRDAETMTVKFTTFDPDLGAETSGDNEPATGSGLYTAELITDSGTQTLEFDPVAGDFNDKEFTIRTDEFDSAKLRLTDWAANSRTYTPALTIEGLETGYLNLTSQTTDGQPVTASYSLVEGATGREFAPEANIPVGTYRLVPLNLAGQYVLANSPEEMTVVIAKDETLEKTVTYDVTADTESVSVCTDDSDYIDRADRGNIRLRLTEIDSGAQYTRDISSWGCYSAEIPFGTYDVDFIGGQPDHPQVWDSYNYPLRRLQLNSHNELHSYTFTLDGTVPGDKQIVPPAVDNYINGQTFMKVTGNAGVTPQVRVYAAQDLNREHLLFTIDKDNGTRSVRELKSPTDSPVATFVFDLTDEQIAQLQPGMILSPTAQPAGGEEITPDKVSVVGYNHPLADSTWAWLKKQAAVKHEAGEIDDEAKTSIDDAVDSLFYVFGDPRNSSGFDIKFRNYLLNRNAAAPEDGSDFNPSLKSVTGMLTRAQSKINEKIAPVYEKLGLTPDDVPVLSIHNGHFPGIRTLLYPTDHDGYSALEVPTTAIVNDLDLVVETLNTHVYTDKEGVAATEDSYGKPLFPEGQLRAVRSLPILAGYVQPTGSRAVSADTTDDVREIDGNTGTDQHVTDSGKGASYELVSTVIARLAVRAVSKGTGYNLADKSLTLTLTPSGSGASNSHDSVDSGSDTAPVSVTTNSQGEAEFTNIVPGSYVLSRERTDDYDDDPTTYEVIVDELGTVTVDGAVVSPAEQFVVKYSRPMPTTTTTATETSVSTTVQTTVKTITPKPKVVTETSYPTPKTVTNTVTKTSTLTPKLITTTITPKPKVVTETKTVDGKPQVVTQTVHAEPTVVTETVHPSPKVVTEVVTSVSTVQGEPQFVTKTITPKPEVTTERITKTITPAPKVVTETVTVDGKPTVITKTVTVEPSIVTETITPDPTVLTSVVTVSSEPTTITSESTTTEHATETATETSTAVVTTTTSPSVVEPLSSGSGAASCVNVGAAAASSQDNGSAPAGLSASVHCGVFLTLGTLAAVLATLPFLLGFVQLPAASQWLDIIRMVVSP